MSFTNPFWGSLGIDTLHCHAPSSQSLLNDYPEWDGFLDLKESIDTKSVLELLEGPMPCSSESRDEWLVEFERLQDVHSRAPAAGVPATPTSSHYNQHAFLDANTNGVNISPRQLGMRNYSPSLCEPGDAFSNNAEAACVQDKTDCPTPTGTRCSDAADDQHPGSRDTVTYTTVLHGWNRTTVCENQRAFDFNNNMEKTMLGLRDMEQNLQADTKLRMSQVKQSHRE
ncbi:hypothetical protein E0Z10_g9270 [Xylaria hypoxylon]|uniref:Uncharacterized protein n=1 Tax=Xylaria hypoxylon TaxID=37992 RepID=A0A4Z0YKW4_9PEZI|nr:hypothetical protein E0Z10_g9270 [Xylaria hypoxylon]